MSGMGSYPEADIIGPRQVRSFSFDLANIADGDILTNLPNPAGADIEIVNFRAIITKAVTTGSKASTLDLKRKNNGTGTAVAITGCQLALTSAACTPIGKVISAPPTGLTSSKAVKKNDTIDIVASSTTAFAEGSVELQIEYRRV